jgi:sec-independent protein translocase protein TatB
MFDIGFSELLLCFIVALVVLGPERLPKVARTVGRWAGQARGYMRNLSAELDRESQLSELKKQLEDAQRLVSDQQKAVRSMLDDVGKDFSETPPAVSEVKPDAISHDDTTKP